ncbi:MAG: SixA phosphatase family protein [Thermoleophilaceae bacterium]
MIWLLRHADAAKGSPDAERPLTESGREQARTAGLALAAMAVRLDACVSSPKVRAWETATLACESLGIEVAEDERLAGGPFDPRAVVDGLGDEVLLVGHDPDFSLAVNHLTGAQVRMPKGGVAAEDRGELKLLLRPAELAALARAR